MKLSFATFACPQWPFERIVDAAVRHSYHGIEFRCDAGHRHGVEVTSEQQSRNRFRQSLESAGIEICCLGTSLRFISSRTVDEAVARIELAGDLGCPALRVFCGAASEPISRSSLVDECARNLRDAADIAVQANVELWLETHDAMSKAVDCAEVVRIADHPAIGINYDNMHPHRMGEPLEATVAALGTLVRHTHFHDSLAAADKVVITRLDEGELPMDEMFAALVNMGFDGYLSGEWFDKMYGDDADESLDAYHGDMTTLAARNGITIS